MSTINVSLELILFVFLTLFLSTRSNADLLELEYDGFTVILDCERRGAIQFEYTAKKDSGNLAKRSSFSLDEDHEIPEQCQQLSTGKYEHSDFSFNRGYLVPPNHLDHLRTGIKQSSYMTNILPQARTMNRGAWKLTEEIIECFRDIEDLKIIGGVIWGHNPDDDYLLKATV